MSNCRLMIVNSKKSKLLLNEDLQELHEKNIRDFSQLKFQCAHDYVCLLRGVIIFVLSVSVSLDVFAEHLTVLPASVEIFTTANNPIAVPSELQSRTILYDLNAPNQILNLTNNTLSADPTEAQLQAKALIANAQFNTNVRDAYQGIARAASYGLTRYPAIVFDDGRAVIYGQTDLNAAIQMYRAWQETHHALT